MQYLIVIGIIIIIIIVVVCALFSGNVSQLPANTGDVMPIMEGATRTYNFFLNLAH